MAKDDKMKPFKIDYDLENDSLFVFLENSKSNGAIEIGNLVLDFNEDNDLVAMEILEASKIFKTILSKMVELSKIREFKADVINMRNMAGIRFSISDDNITERSSFLIPRVFEKSPAI